MFVFSTNTIGVQSNGEQTNTTTATVLADTGALTPNGGRFVVWVTFATDANAQFDIQRRNAANAANVGSVPTVYVPANDTRQFSFAFALGAGERIRVVPNAGITGVCAVTLNYQRVS